MAKFEKQLQHFNQMMLERCETYRTRNWNATSEPEQERYIFTEIKGFMRDILRFLPLKAPRYAQEGRSTTLNLLFEV
jgi:hypothetical protein